MPTTKKYTPSIKFTTLEIENVLFLGGRIDAGVCAGMFTVAVSGALLNGCSQ